jgi:hypothetical protein
MGPRTVPVIKEIARVVSVAEAARVARAALSLSTPDEVVALLALELRDLVPAVRRHRSPAVSA